MKVNYADESMINTSILVTDEVKYERLKRVIIADKQSISNLIKEVMKTAIFYP